MDIALIGYGGHSKVIFDIITMQKNKVVGIFDDKHRSLKMKGNVFLAPIDYVHDVLKINPNIRFVISIGNNKIRKQMFERLALPIEYYTTCIHPSACISPSAIIGKGTVIMPQTVINADAVIGHHTIINTGAVIEHDNEIGDYVHISPRSTLTGSVKVEEGVHLGSASVVIPQVTLGKWSVIGAGSTVIHSIPERVMAVGLPAQAKKILKWSDDID
ncbi:acetyltransferase [Cytobacillus kochii]|uniref:acetyltransferase n=1 Tax=Cytobacillus TaxID=2675230 RepID=UPI002E20BEAC|nr:acetyltransferase [Cytobacillus kochii]